MRPHLIFPWRIMSRAAVLAGCLLATAFAAAADTVWLSDLDLNYMRQGYDRPQKDHSITKKPIAIAGKMYERGVGTHARSTLWIAPGGAERFQAAVGLDETANGTAAAVVFKIVGDGRTLYDSGIVRAGEPARSVDIDIKGIAFVVLIVDDAKNGIDHDHADWADAKFLVSGAPPKAVAGPREDAVILTPKPGPQPRINGTKIFGVRPGSPFLFTVPATGTRPITFAAQGLPDGLKLDPATGAISGSIAQTGKWTVTLEAANAQGKTSRPFRIVCGPDALALTPHLGWNSWYVWESHVTDKIMRAAADAMVNTGLRDHGFMYVNIDDCWAIKPNSKQAGLDGEPRDAKGRVRANSKFPDMKSMTDYIHSKGLKAGIYTGPGPTTCAGHVAAYQHEEADAEQFAEWGFDFLKYDWCSYGQIAPKPDLAALQLPYRKMSECLRRQHRDIVFNLCQYGMGDVWKWGKKVGGHSWRTAGDLGGSFEGIPAALFRDGFDLYSQRELHKYAGPGGWNDPDYLLIGYLSNWRGGTSPSPLSPNEQYTHVSLWSLVAAPLILSGDITRLDDFTLGLLSNDEVIEMDQDPLGKPGFRVSRDDDHDTEVWVRELEDGSKAVGLFNRGEFSATVTANWKNLGVTGKQVVRDLWRQKDLGAFENTYAAEVPRHGVVLLRLRPAS